LACAMQQMEVHLAPKDVTDLHTVLRYLTGTVVMLSIHTEGQSYIVIVHLEVALIYL